MGEPENIDFHDFWIFAAPGMGQPVGDGRRQVRKKQKKQFLNIEARGFWHARKLQCTASLDLRPTMFIQTNRAYLNIYP